MVDSVQDMVRDRFSSVEEVSRYREAAERGLMDWERAVVSRYFQVLGRVLDIGCGGGREAIALHRLGFDVTGIDISATEVESAKSTAVALDLDIDFHACTGDSLSFSDASFDYVIMWAQALGNVPSHASRVGLLKDCARVVKPGGILVFSVHNREVCAPIIREKNMVRTIEGLVLEDGDFILEGDSESDTLCYWHYFDRAEIFSLCDESGWRVMECELAKEFGQADWETVWVCVAEKGRCLQ